MSKLSVIERFWSKVRPGVGGECWEWVGAKVAKGYGAFRPQTKVFALAHRYSWQMHYGPIPEGVGFHGTCVLHRCDNPSCVRPDHLFLGTNHENIKDMDTKGRRNPARGERSGKVAVTADQVLAIRARFAAGESRSQLARAFGVTSGCIGPIVRRATWAHI